MTDKVRIDTLRADLLDANNETFLARQAEFESNVRSYPRSCRWLSLKPKACG